NGDPSDHLDVINLSLGGGFGQPDSVDARAVNTAAQAGVLVAVSAGNNGDFYYISGAPGSAARALTVASSVDSTDVIDGFDVTAPPAITDVYPAMHAFAYDWNALPVLNDVPLYYPATNQYGCDAWTGADATNIAGKIVLVDFRLPGAPGSVCASDTPVIN